ncbi:hypothetical protein [Modestobacter versicolor]|uniref:hypothetical protein n=1 Tax=Modestobacter versicolor TaxID=429133 RepID=UPI0034DE905C
MEVAGRADVPAAIRTHRVVRALRPVGTVRTPVPSARRVGRPRSGPRRLSRRVRGAQRLLALTALSVIALAPVLARSGSSLGYDDALAAELAAHPDKVPATLEALNQGAAVAGLATPIVVPEWRPPAAVTPAAPRDRTEERTTERAPEAPRPATSDPRRTTSAPATDAAPTTVPAPATGARPTTSPAPTTATTPPPATPTPTRTPTPTPTPTPTAPETTPPVPTGPTEPAPTEPTPTAPSPSEPTGSPEPTGPQPTAPASTAPASSAPATPTVVP